MKSIQRLKFCASSRACHECTTLLIIRLYSARVFRQQQLTRLHVFAAWGAIKLASLRDIYLPVFSSSTNTAYRIAVKGISCHDFRPIRFYRTPHILTIAFIVKKHVCIIPAWLLWILIEADIVQTDTHTDQLL